MPCEKRNGRARLRSILPRRNCRRPQGEFADGRGRAEGGARQGHRPVRSNGSRGRSSDGRPRLAQQLEVEKGWERAVETALGSYLEAVCVDGIEAVAESMDSLRRRAADDCRVGGRAAPRKAAPHALSSRVAGPAVVDGLLAGIVAVESLADAIARRKSLEPGRLVITRNGVWLGRDWVRVARERGRACRRHRTRTGPEALREGGCGPRGPRGGTRRRAHRDARTASWLSRQAATNCTRGSISCTTTS